MYIWHSQLRQYGSYTAIPFIHSSFNQSLSGVVDVFVFDTISALTISLVNRSTNSKAFVSGKSISDDATNVPNASNFAVDGFFGVERLYD